MIALARKYRPKNFASVAVQSHVSSTLRNAIALGRVAHGYLLCGPRGVGKTTLARVLAMALNCERRAERGEEQRGEPCGECTSCRRIWNGDASLDVIEIDAASNRGVDDARDLRERAMYAPTTNDRYKVYIVDEAHMLTREAWNALLKILEEPPPRVVFVFATTEPEKIAMTAAPVLSRLQRFDLKRIGPADVRARLTQVLAAEGTTADSDAIAMIARAADGSMRDALSLTDQVLSMGEGGVTAERVRDALGLVPDEAFLGILDLVAQRRAADVFSAVGRLADDGIDFGLFLAGFSDMVRAQLAVSLGGAIPELPDHTRAALESRVDALPVADLLRMLHALGELEQRFRKSGQQQLLLESLLVRFALLDRSAEIEGLLRTLGQGAREGSSAAASATPRGASGSTGAKGAPMTAAPVAPSPWREGSAAADRVAPSAPSAVLRSDRPAPLPDLVVHADGAPLPALELNRVVERWNDVIARLRQEGKVILAGALGHALPASITAAGEIALALDEPNEILARSIEGGTRDIADALRALFAGVTAVTLRKAPEGAPAASPRRMTPESVKAERLAMLRRRDPTLGAAIDALDLDLVD